MPVIHATPVRCTGPGRQGSRSVMVAGRAAWLRYSGLCAVSWFHLKALHPGEQTTAEHGRELCGLVEWSSASPQYLYRILWYEGHLY